MQKQQKIVIESKDGAVIWKHPESNFGDNTVVIVTEGCEAVFVKDGEIFDVLRTGETVINEKKGVFAKTVRSHDCALYGVNKSAVFTAKWGVGDIAYEDHKYKAFVSIGAYGTYRINIGQSVALFRTMGGLKEDITQEKIEKFFFSKVVMTAKNSIAAFLVNKKISYLEINSSLLQIVEHVNKDLSREFANYGVNMQGFAIEGFRFPQDIEKTIQSAQQKAFVREIGGGGNG